ncbi:unnamed protein product [Blepharisma stoltei]|uniref:Uncharacterized protein n=1 Tax=Blepharisma stoltei TaxID=1481888 RepID=A0AAU9I8U3_9CILI|nr:unnamed protein product [Blepharisma stoltei]
MEYRQALEIILLGGKGAGKTKFKLCYDKNSKRMELPYDVVLDKAEAYVIPEDIDEKDGALVLFDLAAENSLPNTLSMLPNIPIPKILVGCNSDSEERKISAIEAKIQAEQNGCKYIEFPETDILFVINMIIGEIENHRENQRKRRCVIRLSFKSMERLQSMAMIMALVSGFFGLAVMACGATLVITTENTSYRWLTNSFLTSGTLTFVMSFVGFYGSKKSGIKEYLKLYSALLIINAIYKLVILLLYLFACNLSKSEDEASIDSVTLVLVLSIASELITSIIIFVEKYAIVEIQSAPVIKDEKRSFNIFNR